MPFVSPIGSEPSAEDLAEREAIAVAVLDRFASGAREVERDRFDLGLAFDRYIGAHRDRWPSLSPVGVADPAPRPMQGSDFDDLARVCLDARVIVVGVRRVAILPDDSA